MADYSRGVPFGGLIDWVRNKDDDEFGTDSFDETYGDPTNPRFNERDDGPYLLLMAGFFFVFVLFLRYGCIYVIDYAILCNHRRNPRRSCCLKRALSTCCPIWFPPLPPPEESVDNNNSSDVNPLEYDEEEGTELTRRIGLKLFLRDLPEETKRALCASILGIRQASEADICDKREQLPKMLSSSKDDTNDDESLSSSNPMVSDENSSPTVSNRSNNNTVSCPICIQDIEAGEPVFECKHCHHLFRSGCIMEWLGTGSSLCPYCRREMFTRDMILETYRKQQQQKKRDSKPSEEV